MFVRVVELIVKPGKTSKLQDGVDKEVREILRRQAGFIGVIALSERREPRRMLVLTFWRTLESAEAYEDQAFPRVYNLVRPLLETEPKVSVFSARLDAEQNEKSFAALDTGMPNSSSANSLCGTR